MTTIDPEGNELVWTAHYWQHGYQDSDEFDSPEAAFNYLDSGQEYGTLAGDHITGPDGAVMVDRDTLRGFSGPDDFATWLGTRALVAESEPALTPKPIQTLSYDLMRLDGTRLVGKAIVDRVVSDGFSTTLECSPSIEPDDSDPNWSTT
jgi:hypothetical protein